MKYLSTKAEFQRQHLLGLQFFLILPMELKLNLGFSVRHIFQMKMQLTLALTYIYQI